MKDFNTIINNEEVKINEDIKGALKKVQRKGTRLI